MSGVWFALGKFRVDQIAFFSTAMSQSRPASPPAETPQFPTSPNGSSDSDGVDLEMAKYEQLLANMLPERSEESFAVASDHQPEVEMEDTREHCQQIREGKRVSTQLHDGCYGC